MLRFIKPARFLSIRHLKLHQNFHKYCSNNTRLGGCIVSGKLFITCYQNLVGGKFRRLFYHGNTTFLVFFCNIISSYYWQTRQNNFQKSIDLVIPKFLPGITTVIPWWYDVPVDLVITTLVGVVNHGIFLVITQKDTEHAQIISWFASRYPPCINFFKISGGVI